ncbi:hypothetical protein GGF32_004494 [Allomyces javanicus]|nr:hypothetical protein GGF32_004494 [Allomyces javanicus]
MSAREQFERRVPKFTHPAEVSEEQRAKFMRRVLNAKALHEPPAWSRRFHAASIVISLGAGLYTALYYDNGSENHVLSSFREWFFGKVSRLTSLSDQDLAELKARDKI